MAEELGDRVRLAEPRAPRRRRRRAASRCGWTTARSCGPRPPSARCRSARCATSSSWASTPSASARCARSAAASRPRSRSPTSGRSGATCGRNGLSRASASSAPRGRSARASSRCWCRPSAWPASSPRRPTMARATVLRRGRGAVRRRGARRRSPTSRACGGSTRSRAATSRPGRRATSWRVGPRHGTHAPPVWFCGSDQWVAGYMEGAVRTGRAAAATCSAR